MKKYNIWKIALYIALMVLPTLVSRAQQLPRIEKKQGL